MARKGRITKSSCEFMEEFRPKTKNQADYIRTIMENDVTFCCGPAGCGKTLVSIGVACNGWLSGDYDKIVISRPCVEAAPKSLGALPGDINDKVSPYLVPATEMLKRFLGKSRFADMFMRQLIVIEPLEFMRGRTFDKSFIIGEEFQNCTTEQIKMFVSRIGESSKMVISGDIEQTDIRSKTSVSGITDLEYVISRVSKSKIDGFGFSYLDDTDIQRNKIIGPFLSALR